MSRVRKSLLESSTGWWPPIPEALTHKIMWPTDLTIKTSVPGLISNYCEHIVCVL